MIRHIEIINAELRKKIRDGTVCFGGNARLKIYGKLNCTSGKRMKKGNRVFFQTQKEAVLQGFRPCGHCLKADYEKWKDGSVQFQEKYNM